MSTKNKQRAKLALAELEKEMEVLSKEEANTYRGGYSLPDCSNSGFWNWYYQNKNCGPCNAWDTNCDGVLSLNEANEWYRNGGGQSIQVNASAVDLGFLDSSSFEVGDTRVVQTLFSSKTGMIYGNITVRYEGNKQFSICDDYYNFEQHQGSGFNTFIRNCATAMGSFYAGEGNGYTIHFEGTTSGR